MDLYFKTCSLIYYYSIIYYYYYTIFIIIRKFGATDILVSYEKLHSKLKEEAYLRLGPFHPLVRLF